jgi:serine/threonine-protein kinase
VALASYIGKSSDQALNELQDAGFSVKPKYEFSETKLAGEVISQTPVGGGTADKGSKITIVISKGTQYAYIPNIFSIEEAKAVRALKDLELKVVVKKIGAKSVKKVTNISPKVGTKVKRGSTVTITVG